MAKLTISFGGGIQKPAKLGSIILKPTAGNKMAYAQNIQSDALEYGEGLIVPGLATVTLTNNSEITGVPIAYTKSRTANAILIIEGVLGATNIARSVHQVTDGSTPQVETGVSETIAHSAHASVVVRDMTIRDNIVYIVGEDGTDGWVEKDDFTGGSISFAAVTTLTTYASGEAKILKTSDNNIYVLHGRLVDQINASDTYTAAAFTLSQGYQGTEMEEWNELVAFAYHVGKITGIVNRKEKGRSGIVLWNFITTANFVRDVHCPANYISAMKQKPDGNLIVFGSARAGMTTLYLFTGYGFSEIYSYIGEPPRNRHSVDFDNEGNIWWQTLDGQICRYNFAQNKFDHITSIVASAGNGGLFTSLLGGTGNEWLAGAGTDASPDTFVLARLTNGNYIGDGAAASDAYNTPLAVSGQQFLLYNSTITAITLHANKNLATGEKVVLRFYKNGNTTSTDYLDMEFAVDGTVSAKRLVKTITEVNNFSLGVVYKQADNLATAPPVFTAIVEYETIIE